MSRVKVNCHIDTYPPNDEPKAEVCVKSHWNYSDRVHILIDGVEVIVVGSDLITAIQNCMRTK